VENEMISVEAPPTHPAHPAAHPQPAPPACPAPQLRTDPPPVHDVADTFIRLMRSFIRMRSQFLAAAQHDVEWSAHVLIAHLAVEGPMRSGALAELVQSDPSTVSRQVAALVRDGFVERRADPEDGRASLLVVTGKGEDVYRDHQKIRYERFQRMMADWSEGDCRTFASLLARFTEGLECGRPDWFPDLDRNSADRHDLDRSAVDHGAVDHKESASPEGKA
jgi:DNA-binding MarR family transcriptional regulator